MALNGHRVARLLADQRGIDDWIVRDSQIRRVTRTIGATATVREALEHSVKCAVFRDGERSGRGAATFELTDGDEGAARAALARAVEEAGTGSGPAWTLPPAAAPARVEVADPIVMRDARGAVDALWAELVRASGHALAVAGATVTAEVAIHRLQTSRGFGREYAATSVEIELAAIPLAGESNRAEWMSRRARRIADLGLAHAMELTGARMAARAQASPLEPGTYDLVLSPEVMTTGEPWGWFAALVAHADARWVRLGLSRYRPGQPVFGATAGGATAGADLTLVSDGTVPFGLRSAPFGELGEPVRRFEIIKNGVAVGLANDFRESALAGVSANGGTGNLVLGAGDTSMATLLVAGERPLAQVQDLRWLEVDARSGDFSAGLGLVAVSGAGVLAAHLPRVGGVVVGNLFRMLGRARFSSETAGHAWYAGPAAIRIDRADVVR